MLACGSGASRGGPCALEALERRLLLDSNLIEGLPVYEWHHGAAPTAAAMVLGYWDTLGYPDFLPGDASTLTAEIREAIASKGDGLGTQAYPGTPGTGHIPDYVYYMNFNDYGTFLIPFPDLSAIDPESAHEDDCIADFMHTSQAAYMNPHGSTGLADVTSGLVQYSVFRGYTSAQSHSVTWGAELTWADVVTEIDAGRPMIFCVDTDGYMNPIWGIGPAPVPSWIHHVPVIGYRTSPTLQYACYTMMAGQAGIQWFDWAGVGEDNEYGIFAASFFHPAWEVADLVGTASDVQPGTMTWGASFTYDYEVTNYGTEPAEASTVEFYLSADDTITDSDPWLGSASIPALGAGARHTGSISLTLPAGAPAGFSSTGFYYVGMVVDADDDVDEGVEDNNSSVARGTDYERVAIYGRPDLQGSSFEISRGILNFGETQATFWVRNDGTSASGSFTVKCYLSEDAVIDATDIELGTRSMGSIPPSDEHGEVLNLTVPTTDPFGGDGTYYLGMVVDANGHVTESDEANNASLGIGLDYACANYGVRIFHADFEHGDGALEIVNDTVWAPEDGLWHHTALRGADAGHSGTHAMYYGLETVVPHYGVGDSCGYFLSKTIELPDEPAALTINHFADVRAGGDRDRLLVQAYDIEAGIYYDVMTKGGALGAGDGGTGGAWYEAVADLSDFAGRRIRLRFLFDTVQSCTAASYEGWYVDDIAIWAATNPLSVRGYRNLRYDGNYTHEASYLRGPGRRATFAFTEDQIDGSIVLITDDRNSAVNPAVAVYDYDTGEMLCIDEGSGLNDEGAVALANSGRYNTYVVELWDTEEDSAGDVDVRINGDGSLASWTIPLDDGGDGSLARDIAPGADTDFFRVTAPDYVTGTLDVHAQVTGGEIHPHVQIWRDDGDDAPEAIGATGTVQLTDVAPGEVFYISVSDASFYSTGDFELRVNFATPLPGELTEAEGFAYFRADGRSWDHQTFSNYVGHAEIGTKDKVDSFYFSGDVAWTGAYTIRVNRLSGDVDPVLALYDGATGEQLAFDDDSAGGVSAQITRVLEPSQRYILAVADDDGTGTGDVEIRITAPSGTSPIAIGLDDAGDGQRSDALGLRDLDFFQLVSPLGASGDLEVTVTPTDPALDAAVVLFDADGNELDKAYLNAPGEAETLSVTGLDPMAAYFLTVLAVDYATSGGYQVSANFDLLVPDEFPGDYSYCAAPNAVGDWAASLPVTAADDWVGWLFASDRDDASAEFAAAGGAGLKPVLGLYDADTGERLAWNSNLTNLETISLNAEIDRHRRYYIVASTKDGTTGPIDLGMDLAGVRPGTVVIDDDGDGGAAGSISPAADLGYFDFSSPVAADGTLTVTLTNVAAGLHGAMYLFDTATGHFLNSGFATGPGGEAVVTFDGVEPSHGYHVAVTSLAYQGGTGHYDLQVDFGTSLPATMTDAEGFAYFHYDGVSHDTQTFSAGVGEASISPGDDVDSFVFAGDFQWTGTYTIEANRVSSGVDPVLAVYDATTGARLGFDDDSGGGSGARLQLDLTQYTRYIVAVADDDSADTGNVEILITAPQGSPALAIGLDDDADGERVGLDDLGANDTDFFRFTAPADADGELSVTVSPEASLDAAVVLFDAAGGEIAKAYLEDAGEEETISVSGLAAGTTYYLTVLASSYATADDYDVYVDFGQVLPGSIDTGSINYTWAWPNQFGDYHRICGTSPTHPAATIAIQPKADGPVLLEMTSDDFAPLLGLYDGSGDRLAWDSAAMGSTAYVEHPGTALEVYYLYCGAIPGTGTGQFAFDVDVPAFPITPIPIDPEKGSGRHDGATIKPEPEQDFYSILAPVHAESVTVTMVPDDPDLRPYLRLYNETGLSLMMNTSTPPGDPAEITISVSPGSTYVIGCGSGMKSLGDYRVDVQFDLYDVPLTVPGIDGYGPLNGAGDREVSLRLTSSTDRAAWQFAACKSGLAGFTAEADAGIDPLLALYDGAGDLVAVGNGEHGPTETLSYSLVTYEIYTVLVQDAERAGAGNVSLGIDGREATPMSMTLDESGRDEITTTLMWGDGEPEWADTDYFEFTAPVNALDRMELTVEPQQHFVLEFQLFDSAGRPVGKQTASPAAGEAAAETYSSLRPGETYHACVLPYRLDDHPAGSGYTITVDFQVPLQVAFSSPADGGVALPGSLATCTVRFAEPLDERTLDARFFELTGKETGSHDVQDMTYDPATRMLTLGYKSLPTDFYTWRITDDVVDRYGAPLDGDGDDRPGEDWEITFLAALHGDHDLDSDVDYLDYLCMKTHYGTLTGARWRTGDFDFDEDVDLADYQAAEANSGRQVTSGGADVLGEALGEMRPAAPAEETVPAAAPAAPVEEPAPPAETIPAIGLPGNELVGIGAGIAAIDPGAAAPIAPRMKLDPVALRSSRPGLVLWPTTVPSSEPAEQSAEATSALADPLDALALAALLPLAR